jgi:hypothetical protein
MRTTRAVGVALVGPALGLLLIGCGPPPWEQPVPGASASPSVTASRPAPTPTPTPTPTATSAPVRNDLSKGSLERKLTAGNTEVTIKYWSTLDLGRWTAGASKPLNVSASAEFTDDSEQDIYLSETKVAIDAVDAAGKSQAVDPLVDEADVAPGYLITAPTSYGQVFTLPAVPAGSRALTLTITYELLVQTAPDVKRYSRQAAVDILQIALAD